MGKKKIEPEDDHPYPPNDGPRYVVSQQKRGGDKGHFLDFFETEKLQDAKDTCINKVLDDDRECIIWDRKLMEIIFRQKSEYEDEDEDNKDVQKTTGNVAQPRKPAKPKVRR